VAGFVVLIVARRFKRPLAEIGLTAKNFIQNVATGLVGYLAIIPALLVLLFVLAAAAKLFSYEPPPQPVVEMYLKKSTEPYLLFFTLFVAIVGPAIEEIFFRGFTYKALRARFGIKWALLGSALIFALLHMNLVAFLPILFLGLVLAYLYEKTGSLVPSMTVHMVHNFIMVSLTLGFKSLSG
jgi:membrane protease YdiL (CAAX protease family)